MKFCVDITTFSIKIKIVKIMFYENIHCIPCALKRAFNKALECIKSNAIKTLKQIASFTSSFVSQENYNYKPKIGCNFISTSAPKDHFRDKSKQFSAHLGRLGSIKLPPNKYSAARSEIFYQQNIIARGHKTHAIAISASHKAEETCTI